MSKVKKIVSLLVLYIFVFFVAIGINIVTDMSNRETDAINEGEFHGLGLFISKNDNDIHNSIMDYSNMSDYKFKLMNRTGKALDCSISVFINGKQIDLIDTENEKKDCNYKLFIDNNEDKEIPIKLNLEGFDIGSYIADISVETDYDKNAVDNDEKVWISSNHNYIVGIDNQVPRLNMDKSTNVYRLESNFAHEEVSQFIANFTSVQFLNEEIPGNYVEAEADTEVEIPIVLGGGDVNNSLIYATLDNKQIKLNNTDILRANFSENMLQETAVKVKVPDKKGKYDLLFYSLNNYEDKSSDEYENIKLSTSHRITLVVK